MHNTLKAIQSSVVSSALVACVHISNVTESSALMQADRSTYSIGGPITSTLVASDSIRLDEVGFLGRHASAHGAYFVDASQIAAIKPRTIADIFRHVPVLLESPFSYENKLLIGPSQCFVTYVDGLLRRGKSPSNLDAFIRVRDVVGAEVYPPAQLPPPPFARSSQQEDCTTVAIWTRRSAAD